MTDEHCRDAFAVADLIDRDSLIKQMCMYRCYGDQHCDFDCDIVHIIRNAPAVNMSDNWRAMIENGKRF